MSDAPLPKPSQPQPVGQPLAADQQVTVAAPGKPVVPVVPATPVAAPTPPAIPVPAKPMVPSAPANQRPIPAPVPTPNQTAAPVSKPQMPPTTLTALSSMSSTNVPPASQQPAPPPMARTSGPGVKTMVPESQQGAVIPEKNNPASAAVAQPPKGSSPIASPGTVGMPSSIQQKNEAPIPPPAATAKIAQPRKSVLKFLPIVLGAVLLLGVVGFALSRLFGGGSTQSVDSNDETTGGSPQRTAVPAQQTTLEYWGLWEPSEVLTTVLTEYENDHPGIKVNYTKQAHQSYRERLQTAITSGNGPDLFRFHATWVPMLGAELAPVPSSVISAANFKSTYYPIASEQLQYSGQYVGMPIMYDGLALLYNKDILDTAGAQPPTTWSELSALASRLTVKSGETVQRSGIAMGNSTNVEHFSDILALLMLQNGADFSKPNSPEVRDALLFYTKFARTDRLWNETLPASTVAFARGDAAMVFAPSWRIHEIQARNPNLKIGVASVPKLSDDRVAWGSYWAEGVNARSKKPTEAMLLLKYLSSKEVLEKLYSEQSKVRSFGELYPRVDMADTLAENPLVAPYLADAPYAKGWYLSSFTHDNGLNDQLIKYYEDAVTAVATGRDIEDVLETLDLGTKQVLRQYGITTGAATSTTK